MLLSFQHLIPADFQIFKVKLKVTIFLCRVQDTLTNRNFVYSKYPISSVYFTTNHDEFNFSKKTQWLCNVLMFTSANTSLLSPASRRFRLNFMRKQTL